MAGAAAVLLAAGESTRMHQPKALLPWQRGLSLLAWQVQTLADAGYEPIVVLLGHEADRLRAELPQAPAVTTVVNDRYQEGRATSVVAGVEALPEGIDAVLVISVDQPRSVALLKTLREAWTAARPPVAVPAYAGKAGHPPLFSAALLPELRNVTEAKQGLREVVARHRAARLLVSVDDPLALTNLNTPEDYEAALAMAQER